MSFSDKVIYQIYPKSFYDSDGDGIGDIPGIIEKIPYLAKLNIDMIWFNPFFVSPQNDNGYDVADYRAIDPRFGTMADFDQLVTGLKAVGIEVMLDMVLNHTSTEHEWFKKALAGDPKYQAYYYIRPLKADGSLPTNWDSKFGGPAWAPFGDTGKYYLHLYDPSQADLDWHNPTVRQEAADIINFWQAKGVTGFRFDVINVIGKSDPLLDAPAGTDSKYMYTDKPIVQTYLKELNNRSFGQIESVTVGEMSSTTIENSIGYTRPENHELSMVFNFHHLKTDYINGEKWTKGPFDFMALKKVFDDWQKGMAEGEGWSALFWNNHDQPRAINRFADPCHFRYESATMLATSIHLLRGTPFIYQGEEIGMTDPDYHEIANYVDVEIRNAYNRLISEGKTSAEAFAIVYSKARDNSRTPMQWDDGPNAGFTTGTPWLKPTNQAEINVAAELDHGQIWQYYQKLIELRKTRIIVSRGGYHSLDLTHPKVWAFARTSAQQELLVYNNFFGTETTVELPTDWLTPDVTVLIDNYPMPQLTQKLVLRPFESIALLKNKQ